MVYRRGLSLLALYSRMLLFAFIIILISKLFGWIGLISYSIIAYLYDVPFRRRCAAKRAKLFAKMEGRPLLNAGAGGGSLVSRLFGPTDYGDVNIDISADERQASDESKVTYGDVHNLPEYKDAEFGAVISSHVLEHVVDPVKAWRELSRVAKHVEVVSPSWWAPHTWIYAQHRWYIDENLQAYPLWNFTGSTWKYFYLNQGGKDYEQ